MYPARFNLRHFMSHLAPGGYYCLYIAAFTSMLFWLLFPGHIEALMDSFVSGEATSVVIAFLIFLMVSYFVGVALRLPPVDYVDSISIEYLLYRQLLRAKAISPIPWYVRLWRWISPIRPAAIQITQVDTDKLPFLDHPIRQRTKPLVPGVPGVEQRPLCLAEMIRLKAAFHLETACDIHQGMPTLNEDTTAFQTDSDTNRITPWLWTTDIFPYPLWMTYKMLVQSTPKRRREYRETLWDVMLDSMGGTISADRPSKEPFNRCKLQVTEESEQLASAIHDNEALIRMMVGFYFGLSLGAVGSAIASALCLGLVGFHFLEWSMPHSATLCGMLLVFWVVSLAFNCAMRRQVLRNFHVLRMSEARAVFDSFDIVQTKPSKRRRRPAARRKITVSHAIVPAGSVVPTSLPGTSPPSVSP